MPVEGGQSHQQDARAKRARSLLDEVLVLVVAKKGLLPLPPPGEVYVLFVQLFPSGKWDASFGSHPLEGIAAISRFVSAERIRDRLASLSGQGVLAAYVEGEYVYADLIEIRRLDGPGGPHVV